MSDKWGLWDALPKMADAKRPAKLSVRKKTKILMKKNKGGLPQENKGDSRAQRVKTHEIHKFKPDCHAPGWKNLLLHKKTRGL